MGTWDLAFTSSESDVNGRGPGSVEPEDDTRHTVTAASGRLRADCATWELAGTRACCGPLKARATVPILLASHLIGTHLSRAPANSLSLLRWAQCAGHVLAVLRRCVSERYCAAVTRVLSERNIVIVCHRDVPVVSTLQGIQTLCLFFHFSLQFASFRPSLMYFFSSSLVLYFLFVSFLLELFLF